MPLRRKLLFSYILTSILPIIIISLILFEISRDNIEETSKRFASMYVSEVKASLNSFEDRFDKLTSSILTESDIMSFLRDDDSASMPKKIQYSAAIKSYFIRLISLYPEIKTVMLVSPSGTLYSWSTAPIKVDMGSLARQKWYAEAQSHRLKPMYISSVHDLPHYQPIDRKIAFTVSRRLWYYDGSPAGVLLCDVDPNSLVELNDDFLQLGVRYAVRMVIANDAGGIVYDSDVITGKRTWFDDIGAEAPPGMAAADPGDTLVLSSSTTSGRLLARVYIPAERLFASTNMLRGVILAITIISILIAFLVSIIYSDRITKPIRALQESMKRFEVGDYTTMDAYVKTKDEIDELVSSYNLMAVRTKELINVVYLSDIKRKQAKISALQAQINPHMLYNTLESIRMKAIVNEEDEIADMIKVLARMFKHTLQRVGICNSVREEIEYASDYIYLQNKRFDDRFSLQVKLSNEVLEAPIIPLAFQPIVENCIVHGFRDYERDLHITIDELRQGPSDAILRVLDDGAGISADAAEAINRSLAEAENGALDHADSDDSAVEHGIGLKNLTERVKLQFGDGYFLRIGAREGGGTAVEMRIPLIPYSQSQDRQQ